MADHFEEVVNLRLHALETRVDDEAVAVQKHFDELRRFITESLNKQIGIVRSDVGALRGDVHALRTEVGDLRTDVSRLKIDVGRLDERLVGYQAANRLEFNRLEQKMDVHHEATHLVLQDILRRLPPV